MPIEDPQRILKTYDRLRLATREFAVPARNDDITTEAVTVIRLLTGMSDSQLAKEMGIPLDELKSTAEGRTSLNEANRAALARILYERSSKERHKFRWRFLEETFGSDPVALSKTVTPMRRRRTASFIAPFVVTFLLLAILAAVSSGDKVAILVTVEALLILTIASMFLLSGGIPFELDVFMFFLYHLIASDRFRASREFLLTWAKERVERQTHYDPILWSSQACISETITAVCARTPIESLPSEVSKSFREDVRALLYEFDDFSVERFVDAKKKLDQFREAYPEVTRLGVRFEYPSISRRAGGSIITVSILIILIFIAYFIGQTSGQWAFAGILVAVLVPSVLWFADKWFFKS